MEILEIIVICLQITAIYARRKHKTSNRQTSGESIENLLYFKDCKQKHTTSATVEKLEQVIAAPKSTPPACPCPRMCCSMCCDCGVPEGPQSFVSRQMAPLQMPSFNPPPPEMSMPQNMPPGLQHYKTHPPMPVQPQIVQRASKRKRMKMIFANQKKHDELAQPPISRRGLGFTRENIKSLISEDQDIKKILKDLVRVAMHKVDLVGAVNSRRSMIMTTDAPELKTISGSPITDDEDFLDE